MFKNDEILRETQKSDGLNRCWVLLKSDQHRTVADVASHLLQAFQLHQSCPHGLLLSVIFHFYLLILCFGFCSVTELGMWYSDFRDHFIMCVFRGDAVGTLYKYLMLTAFFFFFSFLRLCIFFPSMFDYLL